MRPLRVFLCHSSNDKPAVRALYQKLRAEPWIQPWLDEEELLGGQDFDLEIDKATHDADAIIICLSKISVKKEGYVNKEIRRALDIAQEKPEGAIYVIPLRLDDCIPSFEQLKKLHWVDYFSPNAHEKMLKSLQVRADSLGLKIETSTPPAIIASKESQIESGQLSVNKNNTREYYEKLIAQVHEHLKPLPKIVVFCLFKYFSSGDSDVFLKDKFGDANKAAENGFLFVSDDIEFTFILNLDDPAISDAVKWVRRLEKYLVDTLSDDLYELLRSEYEFEPSLKNKRYWKSCLYGKPLY